MKTYEELCITAEHRARLWSDEKTGWLINSGRVEPNDELREMLRSELWNAYQAGFKSGYECRQVEEENG